MKKSLVKVSEENNSKLKENHVKRVTKKIAY